MVQDLVNKHSSMLFIRIPNSNQRVSLSQNVSVSLSHTQKYMKVWEGLIGKRISMEDQGRGGKVTGGGVESYQGSPYTYMKLSEKKNRRIECEGLMTRHL